MESSLTRTAVLDECCQEGSSHGGAAMQQTGMGSPVLEEGSSHGGAAGQQTGMGSAVLEEGKVAGSDHDRATATVWPDNDIDFNLFLEEEEIFKDLESDHDWDDIETKEDSKDEEMKEESLDLDEDNNWSGVSFEEVKEQNVDMEKADYDDKDEHVKVPIEIEMDLETDSESDEDYSENKEDSEDDEMEKEALDLDEDNNWPGISFDEEVQEQNEYMEKADYDDKVEHVKVPIEIVMDEEKVGTEALQLVVSKPLGPYSTEVLGQGCSSWGPYSRDSLNSGGCTSMGLWSAGAQDTSLNIVDVPNTIEATYCEAKTPEDEEEEVYSHEDTVEESIEDVKEVILENIDDLVEDNLGQPVPLVTVKDEFMEEKVKMYVKIKGFPWWPAFFKQEGNIATFLDNQIGHPLEVRDFTDANKDWILSTVRFSKKTGSSKTAFLCDNAKISNM